MTSLSHSPVVALSCSDADSCVRLVFMNSQLLLIWNIDFIRQGMSVLDLVLAIIGEGSIVSVHLPLFKFELTILTF